MAFQVAPAGQAFNLARRTPIVTGQSFDPRPAAEITEPRNFSLPGRAWVSRAERLQRSKKGESLLGHIVVSRATSTRPTSPIVSVGRPTATSALTSYGSQVRGGNPSVGSAHYIPDTDVDSVRKRMAEVLAEGTYRKGHERPARFSEDAIYKIEPGLYETKRDVYDETMRMLGYDLTVLQDGTREWMQCFGESCEHPCHEHGRPRLGAVENVRPLAVPHEAAVNPNVVEEIVLPGGSPLAPVFSDTDPVVSAFANRGATPYERLVFGKATPWCNPTAFAVGREGDVHVPDLHQPLSRTEEASRANQRRVRAAAARMRVEVAARKAREIKASRTDAERESHGQGWRSHPAASDPNAFFTWEKWD